MFFVYGEMCLCLFLVWLHKDAQWFNFYVYYCFTNDNEEEERDEWINEITQLGDFFFLFLCSLNYSYWSWIIMVTWKKKKRVRDILSLILSKFRFIHYTHISIGNWSTWKLTMKWNEMNIWDFMEIASSKPNLVSYLGMVVSSLRIIY